MVGAFGDSSRRKACILAFSLLLVLTMVEGTIVQGPSPNCTADNIVVEQGPSTPLPNGIPTYAVHFINACPSGCEVLDIHVSCRWFSSAWLVDPTIFRRLKYDDCLVNNGKPLVAGGIIYFQYANEVEYNMTISSLACSYP